MMTEQSIQRVLRKLDRFCETLEARLFTVKGTVDAAFYQTNALLHAVPDKGLFGALPADGMWGGEGAYGWFRGVYAVPEALAGQAIYLYPKTHGYEATLWVDGQIRGNYAEKHLVSSHGNHYSKPLVANAVAGQRIDVALEYYAYHAMPGTEPFSNETQASFRYPIGPMDICVRDEETLEYLFDLRTVLSLIRALPDDSFRRVELSYTCVQVHDRLYCDPDFVEEAAFRQGLRDTLPLLKAQLSKRNGDTAPFVGLVGHSHMDTAWLWPMRETIKKCARTYANQLSLMEEYPEYMFVQSSAYHGEMIRANYPELFERIAIAVREGRYEPNGGVWVECDCNITGGEYMIRQFVWGQRFTREHFGYTSDTFWLPDTFGYSYAIPQILKGCGIQYFLTTKISWNDTNRFPYTSFYWQGLDGTRVLTHFNRTHIGPTPETLVEITNGTDGIREKTVAPMRLFSYGKGDGGGGPEFEMVEMSRRVADLEGVPRSRHLSVGAFMRELEAQIKEPTVYADELYLELHRGTFTSQHDIKRNNRKAEIALHDLEALTVRHAVHHGQAADGRAIAPLMNDVLVNQFHDILPGTCIHSVHEETGRVMRSALARADEMQSALLASTGDDGSTLVINSLGFARSDTVYLPAREGMRIAGPYRQQHVVALDDTLQLAVQGVCVPGYGDATLAWEAGEVISPSAFALEGDMLETPHALIRFNSEGGIASYRAKANGRELVAEDGLAWNTFLMGEDLPASWDNWDIDADLERKLHPTGELVWRKVVSEGAVELRIRSLYRLTGQTTILQDMIFSADSPLITFETLMDWQEGHRFLKAAFDTSLKADGARNEIQFGHIRRSNHRNTDIDKAKFEVCNHKFSDLSEAREGIALLNDCKYGLSVSEGSMRLSLHKGGERPDDQGDRGRHLCRYGILPHQAAFDAANVVRPAYAFNYPHRIADGAMPMGGLLAIDQANLIVETVKPCEDAAHAYILRIYEAEGAYTNAQIRFAHGVTAASITNMLEEAVEALPAQQEIGLTFRPFEIKTLRIAYG